MDFDVNIKNDYHLISDVLDFLLSLMRGVTDMLRSIKLFAGVSLFDFLIVIAVMTIVIVNLINIASRPNIRSSGARRRSDDED